MLSEGGGGGALASETRCVCTVNILFVILFNIFNLSKFFVYHTDTKDKTGNHQSHFNAHSTPSSQDERLSMKPVLTGEHVLTNSTCWRKKYFLVRTI